jgi:hypothetical protein
VKLLRADPTRMVFLLNSVEKETLLDILGLYPRVPPSHRRHRLQTKPALGDAENQRLLDEALAEQRANKKRQLQALLQAEETVRATRAGFELHLRQADCEWLIQVLNDVRVGSWIALGEPEELPRQLPADGTKAAQACAMELAGLFQMTLLEAIENSTGAAS